MNTGIFGEGFPYSNFHDLNMDWIIKIAKDFLDQYTHIQQIIADGEASLTNLTEEGLEQLQNKADALEELLQQWYDTHSGDIADQLADALADLNEWYTTHQNYLDNTLTQKIAEFTQQANNIGQQVIDSIPEDYTALSDHVDNIEERLDLRTAYDTPVDMPTGLLQYALNPSLVPHSSLGWHISEFVNAGDILKVSGFVYDATSYPLIITYDNAGNLIESTATLGETQTGAINDYIYYVPDNAWAVYINGSTNTGSSGTPKASKFPVVKEKIKELQEADEICTGVLIDVTTEGTGKVISKALNENQTLGKHCTLSVTPWDKYLISGFVYTADYPLVVFASNGIAKGHMYTTTGNHYNEPIIIPENVDTMYINTNGSTDPTAGGARALKAITDNVNDVVNEGVEWVAVDATISAGNMGAYGTVQNVRGLYMTVPVSGGEVFRITTYETIYPTVLAYNGNEIIERRRIANVNWNRVKNFVYQVPTNATQIIVNGQNGIILEQMKIIDHDSDLHSHVVNMWNNKTAVWFGTSIPASGGTPDVLLSYPCITGMYLGMNVINDSFGTSCVHCKNPAWITENNPYGFISDFEVASRCMSNSLTEMQWIIDHYDSAIWTSGTVPSMTEALATQIKSHSYEILLDKYLTPSTFPDLFVFDHGNNDTFNSTTTENEYYQQYGEYSTYTFRGAMNFLIQRILNYNSHAQIVLIGQYTGKETDQIPSMQMQVAKDWELPICKQWELLGWTKTKNIVCKGHWEVFYTGAYIWVDDPTESNTMSVFASWIPDGLHPHTDISGRPVKKMAQTIAKWLSNH